MFADVEGSTKLLHALGETGYAEALARHRSLLRAAFARHGGVEVDTQGDAFFVAFGEAAAFPLDGLVWDRNYRGELQFLEQARGQQRERRLQLHDGWRYILHGWFQALSAIFRWSDDAERFAAFVAAGERARSSR